MKLRLEITTTQEKKKPSKIRKKGIILQSIFLYLEAFLTLRYIVICSILHEGQDIMEAFFHFGGNSLRRVHVFLRHPEKTYHPFFGPEMGVLTLFSKKRPKRPKKFFKQREGKFFFTSVYLAK